MYPKWSDYVWRFLGCVVCVVALWALSYFLLQRYDTYNFLLDRMIYYQAYIWRCLASGVLLLTFSIQAYVRERVLRYLILFSHVIWLLYIFMHDVLLFTLVPIIIVLCLLCLLYLCLLINHRIRYIFVIPLGLLTCVVFVFFLLPRYERPLSLDDFYTAIGNHLYISTQDTALLLKEWNPEIRVFSLNVSGISLQNTYPITDLDYRLSAPLFNDTQIHYLTAIPLYNTFAMVQFFDGKVVAVPPQSIVSLYFEGTWYSYDFTWSIDFTGYFARDLVLATVKQKEMDYMQNQHAYVIWLWWGSLSQNVLYMYIAEFLLSHLAEYLPYYQDNLDNFYAFRDYYMHYNLITDIFGFADFISSNTTFSWYDSYIPEAILDLLR